MVEGLDRFVAHFADDLDGFVLIGGTACTVFFEQQGLTFRATRDLDVVLFIDVLSTAFFDRMWDFLNEGGYHVKERSDGRPLLFRFSQPTAQGYPFQIELFCGRLPEVTPPVGQVIVPIRPGEDAPSLSAILLDDDYYELLVSSRQLVEGLPVTPPTTLIPLKARACLDLRRRRELGESVDERSIRKHRNDILRLYGLLAEADVVTVPPSIADDLQAFLAELMADPPDLKSLGLPGASLPRIIDGLRTAFGLDAPPGDTP